MTIEQFLEWLKRKDACTPARTWAETQPSVQEVWDNCERGHWLLWLLANAKYANSKITLLVCDVVRNTPLGDGRTVWDLMTDERSRNAIVVAEKFARKEATIDELRAAARAAVRAADAAAWDAAADAAAWDAAADAAVRAARAAVRAAVAAVAADWDAAVRAAVRAADAAAVRAAAAWQADYIRSKAPFKELQKLLELCQD